MKGTDGKQEEDKSYVRSSIDPQLEELQRIEAGGPPKPVNFNTLPIWLRYFGYFFVGVMIIMGLFGALASMYDTFSK